MTIQHTVVFRLVHETGSPEEREFLATGRAVLTSIPGVEEFTIRRQVSPKSDLEHQFSMVFRDRAAYRAYDAHPAHTAFVSERWVPEVAAFQEYDFEE
ncbi:Dabb family protein [Microbacterium sp. NPDC088619]|uniref:Dabb family protein n=1 Tax=Microbacterium sp. NPDC088619 TaxID=3364196 RepID=UPI0037F9C955